MTVDDARAVIRRLQAGIDGRDRDGLLGLFEENAVLIGTSAHAPDRESVVTYLTAVAEGEPFRWEFSDVVQFGEEGFAAFGEIVAGNVREPFRLTLVLKDGKIANFHGSIPYRG